jgi:hypothetical protein
LSGIKPAAPAAPRSPSTEQPVQRQPAPPVLHAAVAA